MTGQLFAHYFLTDAGAPRSAPLRSGTQVPPRPSLCDDAAACAPASMALIPRYGLTPGEG